MKIRSVKELSEYIDHGNRVKYVFFWGHKKSHQGVTKSCLSQWFSSPYYLDGITYNSAEHFMMAEKARLFNDESSLNKILQADDPGKAKALGREVTNFNQKIWEDSRMEIVINANYHKFHQNPHLADFLIGTGDRVLVEASPVDRIWGIGLEVSDSKIENPHLWKGTNLLGFALMEVREMLGDK